MRALSCSSSTSFFCNTGISAKYPITLFYNRQLWYHIMILIHDTTGNITITEYINFYPGSIITSSSSKLFVVCSLWCTVNDNNKRLFIIFFILCAGTVNQSQHSATVSQHSVYAPTVLSILQTEEKRRCTTTEIYMGFTIKTRAPTRACFIIAIHNPG